MKIQDLLSDETRWCKGTSARDCNNNPCHSRDSVAVRWCLLGALLKVYDCGYLPAWYKIQHHLHESTSAWNDAPERTFSEVRELIEKLDI